MNRLIGFGASLIVNLVLVGAVGWAAHLVDTTPAGKVEVVQLNDRDTGNLIMLARTAP